MDENFKDELKNKHKITKIMDKVFNKISIALLICWAISVFGFGVGGLIHVLLIIASVTFVLYQIEKGRYNIFKGDKHYNNKGKAL